MSHIPHDKTTCKRHPSWCELLGLCCDPNIAMAFHATSVYIRIVGTCSLHSKRPMPCFNMCKSVQTKTCVHLIVYHPVLWHGPSMFWGFSAQQMKTSYALHICHIVQQPMLYWFIVLVGWGLCTPTKHWVWCMWHLPLHHDSFPYNLKDACAPLWQMITQSMIMHT